MKKLFTFALVGVGAWWVWQNVADPAAAASLSASVAAELERITSYLGRRQESTRPWPDNTFGNDIQQRALEQYYYSTTTHPDWPKEWLGGGGGPGSAAGLTSGVDFSGAWGFTDPRLLSKTPLQG